MRLLLDTHAPLWFLHGSDRLSMVAQASIEEATLVSADRALDKYGVSRLW